jgi:hypothetical protein
MRSFQKVALVALTVVGLGVALVYSPDASAKGRSNSGRTRRPAANRPAAAAHRSVPVAHQPAPVAQRPATSKRTTVQHPVIAKAPTTQRPAASNAATARHPVARDVKSPAFTNAPAPAAPRRLQGTTVTKNDKVAQPPQNEPLSAALQRAQRGPWIDANGVQRAGIGGIPIGTIDVGTTGPSNGSKIGTGGTPGRPTGSKAGTTGTPTGSRIGMTRRPTGAKGGTAGTPTGPKVSRSKSVRGPNAGTTGSSPALVPPPAPAPMVPGPGVDDLQIFYIGMNPLTRTFSVSYTSPGNPALQNGPATLLQTGFTVPIMGSVDWPTAVAFMKGVGAPGW